MGVTYTDFESGAAENILKSANSAQIVFPLPVGAPTNTSSSVLYRELNTAGGSHDHTGKSCDHL